MLQIAFKTLILIFLSELSFTQELQSEKELSGISDEIFITQQAIAGFNIRPSLKPKLISKKIEYTISMNDTIDIWSNSTNRFYRVYIDGKWGWIEKNQVILIENTEMDVIEKNNENKFKSFSDTPKKDEKNTTNNQLNFEFSDKTYNSKTDDKDFPNFFPVLIVFLILILLVEFVISLSLVTNFVAFISIFILFFAYPWHMSAIIFISLIFAYAGNIIKEQERNETFIAPVPSYEINSYNKDEIIHMLLDKPFKWNGSYCKMKYIYDNGTIWIVKDGLFDKDRVVRANTLYKEEIIKIYMRVFGEQEPPPGYYVREPIPQRIKDKVWNRDNGKCVKCGSNIDLEYDHIKPVSAGGKSTYRNLQLLCQTCNRSKGAKIE